MPRTFDRIADVVANRLLSSLRKAVNYTLFRVNYDLPAELSPLTTVSFKTYKVANRVVVEAVVRVEVDVSELISKLEQREG